jgi:tetratricopeptide (TPR) repeat protein
MKKIIAIILACIIMAAMGVYIKKNQNKNTIKVMTERGESYLKSHDDDKAIECFTKVLEIHPKNYDANIKLGVLYEKKGDLDNAITYFQNSASIQPNNVFPYQALGIIYIQKKDYDSAINYCNKGLSINPNESFILVALASIYSEKKDYIKEIEYFKKALAVNPNEAQNINQYLEDAYINLANEQHQNNQYDESLKNYDEALKINPSNQEVLESIDNTKHIIESEKMLENINPAQ